MHDNYEKELISLKEIIANMNTEIEGLKNIIIGLRENNNNISSCKCISTRDCEQICDKKINETIKNHHDNTNHQKNAKISETIDNRITQSNKNINILLLLELKQTCQKIASMEIENAASRCTTKTIRNNYKNKI